MMKRLFTTGTLASARLTISFVPSAKADEWDKKTVVTIHEQIQIQGTTLEPGVYVIKLLDSPSDRRILQVFNDEETELQAIILANAAYRLEPTGDTRFTFSEVPAGQSPTISTWFYPADNYGLHFSVR